MAHNVPNPVITVPVYKEIDEWNNNEFKSFRQCCQILGHYPICLVGPHKLNWKEIKNFINKEYKVAVSVASFPNQYFADIPGYNKILKSLFFYKHFKNYSHLLLYQLDAYVFRDELLEWCKKEYDYIGAPWLEGYCNNASTIFVGVGNGGFSLHNIRSAIKVLKQVKTILGIIEPCEKSFLFKRVSYLKWINRYLLLKIIYRIKNQKYVLGLSMNNDIYEDKFWGVYIPTTFNDFKVASIEDAIKFSFEVNPRLLYQINSQNLPFGCHAWEKYDPIFWSEFIA